MNEVITSGSEFSDPRRSRGQVIDLFTKKSKTCPSDLNIDIMYFEATDESTNYMLTEIWIRPTITYGLVACFVTETQDSRMAAV